MLVMSFPYCSQGQALFTERGVMESTPDLYFSFLVVKTNTSQGQKYQLKSHVTV